MGASVHTHRNMFYDIPSEASAAKAAEGLVLGAGSCSLSFRNWVQIECGEVGLFFFLQLTAMEWEVMPQIGPKEDQGGC